jgi:hypothetical protein
MPRIANLCRFLTIVLFCCGSISRANAAPLTFTGAFTDDDSVFTYSFTTASTQVFNFYTTSYGGGLNLNGSVSPAGGFDPVLTLFSNATGNVLGFGGGDGTCAGSSSKDPVTGLCEDANFSETLGPGSYTLDLTEFPNVAVGQLSDGFLFAGDASFTGDFCGVSGGKFLESDLSPCVARTANYALDVNSASAVPEPSTLLLVAPTTAAIAFLRRRRLV